jgi:hypothetical protein
MKAPCQVFFGCFRQNRTENPWRTNLCAVNNAALPAASCPETWRICGAALTDMFRISYKMIASPLSPPYNKKAAPPRDTKGWFHDL